MKPILDADERRQALDPEGSFIVQAPAGSGKTELLTQRFLGLLARVRQPEEIVAITFTRKAAAEMRIRILAALEDATGPCPQAAHKRATWELARAALARDEQAAWQLRLNPNRLRIQTFDSLCASLARQLPLLSELGATARTREDATALYREAAQATLARLNEGALRDSLSTVLRHLDNRLAQLGDLLVQMLGKRDQWLPHLHASRDIEKLESALANLVAEQLEGLDRHFTPAQMNELVYLAGFAARHLPPAQRSDPRLDVLVRWEERHFRPDTAWEDLGLWQGLAKLLLTDSGGLRKQVNRNIGFPTDQPEAKARVSALLDSLREEVSLVEPLHAVRKLPLDTFDQEQHELLAALRWILMDASAQLDLVFQDHAEIDFIEVQLRALRALGSNDAPSDLALLLDYRIQHLLVDEFQDTSVGQYRLLEGLTAGWQPDDGRTLFVVGDPMQSIYRFRKAEVSLFLQAWQRGLQTVPLEPLRLQMNFRSQEGVVEWVNDCFSQLFPEEVDITLGAMPYAASVAHHAAIEGDAVQIHALAERDDVREAETVVALIQQQQLAHPQGSIAVLARARAHLHAIAAALQQADIPYQAVKVDPLGSRPTVQDLHSLTRALLHPADRLSWLSLLRSPLVGISTDDLVRLCGDDHDSAVWRLLHDEHRLQSLSTDGRARVERVRRLLQPALPLRCRGSLIDRVEATWLSLGGAVVADVADAHAYLDLLARHEQDGTVVDFNALEMDLQQLFAPPDSRSDGKLQLMTMHQAKGLEFDTVILPGLGMKPRNESHELLYWLELPDPHEEAALLMAPIKGTHQEHEPISACIRWINRSKQEREDLRLLYVAPTRARRCLHLLGHVRFKRKGGHGPEANSLLARLWPAIGDAFSDLSAPADEGMGSTWHAEARREYRIAVDWQADIDLRVRASESESATAPRTALDFDWSGDAARHVGTVTHRYLERIAHDGLSRWPPASLPQQRDAIQAALATLGIDPDDQDSGTERVLQALTRTLAHEQGRWILSAHAEAACELPVTALDETGQPCQYVIDRTFVAEGARWIVDYKTSEPGDMSLQAFLDQEQAHYRAQLERYARIMQLLEDRPVRLALYFPLAQAWRVWDA